MLHHLHSQVVSPVAPHFNPLDRFGPLAPQVIRLPPNPRRLRLREQPRAPLESVRLDEALELGPELVHGGKVVNLDRLELGRGGGGGEGGGRGRGEMYFVGGGAT